MYRQQEPVSEWRFVTDVIKIAMGVFIGAILAALAYEQLWAWRTQQAVQQLTHSVQQEMQQTQKAQAEQAKAKQRRELEQEWAKQQADLAQAEALAARRAKAAQKEQAWQRFYQPSAICRADPSRGDCADAHIRAKKAFEAQYRAD